MKWAFAGLGAVITGMLTLMGIFLLLDATMVNEEDYYSLKETMEASMYDAIDVDYYQNTGEIKIIEERFVEIFTRRFVEETSYGKNGYVIEFYDIIESPPKASVKIYGKTDEYKLTLDNSELLGYDIINKLDSILLYDSTHLYTYEYYAVTAGLSNSNDILKNGRQGGSRCVSNAPHCLWGVQIQRHGELKNLIPPEEIADKTCEVVNAEYTGPITTTDELQTYFNNINDGKWYKKDGAMMASSSMLEAIKNTIEGKSGYKLCQIETVDHFSLGRKEESNGTYIHINQISVTLPEDCLNIAHPVAGIKYNITWKCTS